MKTRKLLHAAVCSAALALGAVTLSQSAWAQRPASQEQSAVQRLSIREVYDALEKQGYRNFTEIELEWRKRGRGEEYDVKADNAAGEYVKLRVDAATGNILDERVRRGSKRGESKRR